jgi:hypothetical protein
MVRHAKQSRLTHPLLHPPHRSQVKPPSARGFLAVPVLKLVYSKAGQQDGVQGDAASAEGNAAQSRNEAGKNPA